MEGEVARLGKIKAELVIEKDQILRERLDLKIGEERQKQETKKMRDMNDDLIKQVEDLQRKLAAVDPEVLKEQKELIADLNNKVAVLERELQLVHENFEHEIEQYKVNGGAKKRGGAANTNELEEMTLNKVKQELVKTRHELDMSTKQINGLQ